MTKAPQTAPVLVVDDEPDIKTLLKQMLSSGFEADTYSDPVSALSEFKVCKYRLAIIDFKMKGMNGFELYDRIRSIDKNIRVLFLSADAEHYSEYKRQYPANDSRKYMHKPVRMNELLKQVEEILG